MTFHVVPIIQIGNRTRPRTLVQTFFYLLADNTQFKCTIHSSTTYPGIWTQRFIDTLEIIAWLIVFAFDLLAAVKVNIVLPAVPEKSMQKASQNNN